MSNVLYLSLVFGPIVLLLGVKLLATKKRLEAEKEHCKQLSIRLNVEKEECERRLAAQEQSIRAQLVVTRLNENGTPERQRAQEVATNLSCVVCFDPLHSLIACVPCGHVCMCKRCYAAIRTSPAQQWQLNCPICCVACNTFLEVFIVGRERSQEEQMAIEEEETDYKKAERTERKKRLKNRFFRIFS